MLHTLATKLVSLAVAKKIAISLAESCTGGLVASSIVSVDGSSAVLDCGFVSYSYESKVKTLKVDPKLIKDCGAVSKEVSIEMAIGALRASSFAELSISVTGIAGPTGATETKPIGLVYFTTMHSGQITSHEMIFQGDRNAIRTEAAAFALTKLIEILENI